MTEKIKSKKKTLVLALVVVLAISYFLVALLRPESSIKPSLNDLAMPQTRATTITWPSYGQSAVGAMGYGLLATNGEQKPAPIASIAKTMVGLAVLKEKPLKLGEQGPVLTMTAADEELYRADFAQNGSVVPIRIGEELSEYQMLQALLLPSGDNIASTLAIWAFGSVDGYLTYANKLAKDMGLSQTHFDDASGLSHKTVSSAGDLVILGNAVMQDPVLAEVVGQSKVTLPVAGLVRNYNTLLGVQNVVGIKTGNTDEAGGCFLFAAKTNVGGTDLMLVGVILGATSRNKALADTNSFLQVNQDRITLTTAVPANTVIGKYKVPWGKEVNAIVKNDAKMLTASGVKMEAKVDLNKADSGSTKDQEVGKVNIASGSASVSVPVVLDGPISKPSILWRLTHIF